VCCLIKHWALLNVGDGLGASLAYDIPRTRTCTEPVVHTHVRVPWDTSVGRMSRPDELERNHLSRSLLTATTALAASKGRVSGNLMGVGGTFCECFFTPLTKPIPLPAAGNYANDISPRGYTSQYNREESDNSSSLMSVWMVTWKPCGEEWETELNYKQCAQTRWMGLNFWLSITLSDLKCM
jgi:hypothetical protein